MPRDRRRPVGASARSGDRRGPFIALCGLLGAVFLFGGGSRPDIVSLMLLRPVSVLLLGYGLLGLTRAQIVAHRLLFAIAIATLGLVTLQLIPLPPAVWHALPGRAVVAEIDRVSGLGEVWRPLSLVPYGTRNALFSLVAPMAVLVLGVQLDYTDRRKLLPLLIAFGATSAVIAVLQLLGGGGGALYFYRITNNDAPVGLFANRNHQATLLALMPPMLVVWAASRADNRRAVRDWFRVPQVWTAVGALALVIPLLLITGSRSGLLWALAGLAACPLTLLWRGQAKPGVAREPAQGLGQRRAVAGIAVGLVAVAGATLWLGRATTLDRWAGSSTSEELRLRILPTVGEMIREYAPWGSGYGSFDQVFRMHEPASLLRRSYMNHAHNDWLEAALTGGLPALVVLLVVVVAVVRRALRLAGAGVAAPDRIAFGRLGIAVMVILGLASLTDYPLRTSALACVFVVAALWATLPADRLRADVRH